MSLRESITEIIKKELCPIPEDKQDPNHPFYFQSYEDNLIQPMVPVHRDYEYGAGSGGELKAKGNRPAKMASIASSSAMTFNILGNEYVTVNSGKRFASGAYGIQYEKQLYTLNKGSNPANLDAFLFNPEAREAIFCEMKMLEWLGAPRSLKDAYLQRENYFCEEAYDVFSEIARSMIDAENKDGTYRSKFSQYDAWQMFKHTLAIFNGTSRCVKEKMNAKQANASVAGRYDKVTLVNVVFELPPEYIKDPKTRDQYCKALGKEHTEADAFRRILLAPQYGLQELFQKRCGVEFDVVYLPVARFVACFEKTKYEKQALKRYCCN